MAASENSEKRFISSFQNVKFQEKPNVFSKASVLRKCLSVDFYGCINTCEDESTSASVLDSNLKDYARIVDDQSSSGVNNYSASVLSLISTIKPSHHKQWKTGLDSVNINDYLKPLYCGNRCNNLNNYSDEVKSYKSARILSAKVEIGTANLKQSGKRHEHQVFSNVKNVKQIQDKSWDGPDTSKSSQCVAGISPRQQVNTFKTARDELKTQNLKKFGRANVESQNCSTDGSLNYGSSTKSLGTRKGNIRGKFLPPIKSKDDGMYGGETKPASDEEVDERLKNIDPKMVELIKNEIMDCGSSITWSDIAGLELAKTTIQEIVVWPMLRPDIFTGLRRPPKGILLFGPPGTGKTLIGKCIASQSGSTFFSISASSLTSKWIGDGEKMVRALFAVARVQQPAVVFIDEIDSLLSQRSDTEHESSRRLKTEFLIQLDGAATGEEDRILIVGATNRPQELDEAARRRLVKRLYIPLPDKPARKTMLVNLLRTERHTLVDEQLDEVASLTEGYSGADVKNLCQEASLGPIRAIPHSQIQNINLSQVRGVSMTDFKSALTRIKSSVSGKDLDTYLAWDQQFGCGFA